MNLDIESIDSAQYSAQELLALVSERISVMLEQEPDLLMSLLYRLDVEEKAILEAMHPANHLPANIALAQLVLDRQKQRLNIKKNTAVNDENIPEGWEW